MTDLIETPISRRSLLQGAGGMLVAFSLPTFLLSSAEAAHAASVIGPGIVPPDQLDSWLAIGSDGTVTVLTGKVELGTGVETATLQLAAEELDVALDKLELIQADTWMTVDQSYTSGSQSIKTQWGSSGVRQAAAEARAALLNMASTRLAAPVSQLTVKDGVVSVIGNASATVSYADLIGDQRFNLRITGKAKPKTADTFTIVGKSIPRRDVPAKLYGTFAYTQDVRVDGMLHGRVVRPPSLDATLVRVDGFDGKKQDGLVKVVVKNNFVAVVAESEAQAIKIAAALKLTWKTTPLPDPAAIYDIIKAGPSQTDRVLIRSGDVDAALAGAATVVRSEYRYPYQMHGSIGASCAVADVQPDAATVWSSTQGVYQLRGALATLLNLPAGSIHVRYVEGSGCYGLNGADTVAMDAALMSQATGRPVRAQNMRSDEHGWENYGNAMVMQLAAGLDATGRIIGWDYAGWSAGRGSRPGPPGNVPTGVLAGFPEPAPAKSPPSSPPLGPDSSNTVPTYVFPAQRVVSHAVPSRFFTAPLRSPARIQNTFANESFMDELASAAKADPVAFRLAHLTSSRLQDVIKGAAEQSKWSARTSPQAPSDARLVTGRGIAAMQYEGTDAFAGVVTQVEVDKQTGKVRVQHVWATQDCGLTINPDGMRAQAEGCVIQGVSRALREELKWTPEKITSIDWVSYPILRFPDMPVFDFKIIDRPDQPPLGAGEVVITAMVASIANAIFDATGARLRQVPFTPARVRAGLAAL
ncbi:MAG: nicotinate dehydrogenase subunit [Solirubrobacteraceae bacterium]|nr:nicotinate dehydrogenase subunit [Solirubrobacteraceae bacterium]